MQNKFEKSSFIVLLATIIIAPLAFIPTVYVPLDMVKTSIITIGVLLSVFLYIISTLKNKNTTIPGHPLFVIGCGIATSIIVSTVFSLNISRSLFGQGFEIGTASFLLIMLSSSLIIAFLTQKDLEKIRYIFGAIFTSFGIIALFHIVRLFTGADMLTLGFLHSPVSTMLGKWNDLSIFSGLILVVSYLSLRFSTPKKFYKILLYILILISIFFVFIVNLTTTWISLAIIFALISVFEFYINKSEKSGFGALIKRVPVMAVIILFISCVGITAGDRLSLPAINKFKVNNVEAILPWQFTLDIASQTIKESPLFGAGPNRFGAQYLKYKPIIINQSDLWNMEFNSGYSMFYTFVVTQGTLGLILWLLFVIFFFYAGYKALRSTHSDTSRCFVATTFFGSAFLWVISIIYLPSHVTLFFTFILTGLFVSVLIKEGRFSMIEVNHDASKLFKLRPLFMLLVIVVMTLWLATFIKKAVSLTYFYNGISYLNTHKAEDFAPAEKSFKKALFIDRNDTYLLALSEVNIQKITNLAQSLQAQSGNTDKTVEQESVKNILSYLQDALKYTKEAIGIDPTNHYNHLASARASSMAMNLRIPGEYYETTKSAYLEASKYNPFDPSTYLNLARVEALSGKVAEAERYIGASLQLKPNYLDAIYLLSQIQVSQNKIKDAIVSVQVASQINPNNPLIFFQLGFLHYNDKNYQAAIDALNTAIKLDNQYANARYFLGLSYARINNMPDAIIQFETLLETNPDNAEIKLILSNLLKGRSPFADAKPPIDSKPEKRASPPIKDKAKTRS